MEFLTLSLFRLPSPFTYSIFLFELVNCFYFTPLIFFINLFLGKGRQVGETK